MSDYIPIMTGSDLDVGAREVTEPDGVTKVHQTAVFAAGALSLPSSPQINGVTAAGVYPGTAIDVQGYGTIVIKPVSDTEDDAISVKVRFYDVNGTLIGESDEQSLTANVQDGTTYVASTIVIENRFGACSVKVHLTADPSGSVSFYISGV